jgi:hypothetical protein
MQMAGRNPGHFFGGEHISHVVPANAGIHSLGRMFCEGWGHCECSNKRRCLWVPAFEPVNLFEGGACGSG